MAVTNCGWAACWTIGRDSSLKHFPTFSSHPSLAAVRKRNSSFVFVFLREKAPKGSALSFTTWNKVLKIAQREQGSMYVFNLNYLPIHCENPYLIAYFIRNVWDCKWSVGVSPWRDKRKAPRWSLLAFAPIFVQQNLKLFPDLNNRWHCHCYIFPGKKPLQFAISPSRRHQQFL